MNVKFIIKSLMIFSFLSTYLFSSTTNKVNIQNNQSKVDNKSLLKTTAASGALSFIAKTIATKLTTSTTIYYHYY